MKMDRLPIPDESRVEMIPLIDVVFLVLAAFIYASAFLSPKVGIPVDLPRADQAEVEQTSLVNITIEEDGSLYLDDRSISLADLPSTLAAVKRNNNQVTVYVKADRRVRIEPLIRILDIARAAEMAGLTIATQRELEASGNRQ